MPCLLADAAYFGKETWLSVVGCGCVLRNHGREEGFVWNVKAVRCGQVNRAAVKGQRR
jgi:hypothetical protein